MPNPAPFYGGNAMKPDEKTASGNARPKAGVRPEQPAKSRRTRNAGLFPCEAEIARRLSQMPAEWKAKAVILGRDGLPRIDPLMGGRFWPAVEDWWRRRYGLSSIEVPQLDGKE